MNAPTPGFIDPIQTATLIDPNGFHASATSIDPDGATDGVDPWTASDGSDPWGQGERQDS